MAKDQALLKPSAERPQRYQTLAKQEFDRPAAGRPTRSRWSRQVQGGDHRPTGRRSSAELNVAYTHIVSPVTGRVGLRLVDPGQLLHLGDATGIVVITQVDPISVDVHHPEEQLPPHLGSA